MHDLITDVLSAALSLCRQQQRSRALRRPYRHPAAAGVSLQFLSLFGTQHLAPPADAPRARLYGASIVTQHTSFHRERRAGQYWGPG
jgi:hypothetical protein